jgi:predicted RNA-binding Zn-ribbon protein involved in translation (DUF1610 family)
MDAPPSADEERRCPNCGALVAADAQWCGQCFESLVEPEPEPEPEPVRSPESEPSPAADTSPTPAGAPPATAAPTWPCPACGNANAIELDACAVCGTSFAALMRQGEERPKVEPKTALAWSLIFPGLGHRKVGRGMDGLARGVLFAMLFVMALLTGLSAGGSGVLFGLFALFLGLAVVVYAGTAWEAYHLAEGGEPVVSARALLWATVGVIFLSVAVLALTVITAAKR